MTDVESFDGMELALTHDAVHLPPAQADAVPPRSALGASAPADPILRALHAELDSALCWLDGVSVQLSCYEASPLFLSEPRQRAKLVGYVAEKARRFRELGSDETCLSWRDEPALIAADSLRLRRTPGAAQLLVDRVADAARPLR